MVGEHENFMIEAFLVEPPVLEGLNEGQELTIMSFVSSFGCNRLLT